ncbi:MAG TPA: hypothetical protein VGB79_02130 [Allosphingosinicella sp.]|jgi:hypothetical protein
MITSLAPVLAVLALSGAPTASSPRNATVVASVANSEWTRSGEVSLDLRTGRYRLRHAPSRLTPYAAVPFTRGRLRASELERIRAAYAAARAKGLEDDCSNGNIVISNGGADLLVLTEDGSTMRADLSVGCFTREAMALGRLLEDEFGPRARPPRE